MARPPNIDRTTEPVANQKREFRAECMGLYLYFSKSKAGRQGNGPMCMSSITRQTFNGSHSSYIAQFSYLGSFTAFGIFVKGVPFSNSATIAPCKS